MVTLSKWLVPFLGQSTLIESLPVPDAKVPFVITQEWAVPTDATYGAVVSSHKVSGPVITESGFALMNMSFVVSEEHPLASVTVTDMLCAVFFLGH